MRQPDLFGWTQNDLKVVLIGLAARFLKWAGVMHA